MKKIQKIVSKICKDDFRDSDIGLLFIWLRNIYCKQNDPILYDISNFIAHYNDRNEGASFDHIHPFVENLLAVYEKDGKITALPPVFRREDVLQRLAKTLSNLGDLYVNDAFGNIHRDHDTSMLAITKFLPSYAGFLVAEEVKYLNKILAKTKKLVMIFGGAKVSSKLFLIQKFLNKADHILLGGKLANTILASRGYVFNQASYDQKELKLAKRLNSVKILLPVDGAVAKSLAAQKADVLRVEQATKNNLCVDIGPATVEKYLKILKKADMIVWNGPLGYFENKLLTKNSQNFIKILAKLKQTTIIGGGETVELANRLGLLKQFNFVSTGGGAMMTFLEGKKLPALEALIKK